MNEIKTNAASPAEPITINLKMTWQQTLPLLLGLLIDGTSEGQSYARRELLRMATAADAACTLAQASGASAETPASATAGPPTGYLARIWCGKTLPLEVCYSVRGFYIGTYSEDGPCSRESVEYWPTRELAAKAMETSSWTQRSEP